MKSLARGLISLQDGGVTPVNPTQQNQYLTRSRPQMHLVSNELPFLGRSSAGLVHSGPSAASDPQAGRQGKEGWVFSAFLIQRSLSCISSLFFCFSFVRSGALLLNQPPAPWCSWSDELGKGPREFLSDITLAEGCTNPLFSRKAC